MKRYLVVVYTKDTDLEDVCSFDKQSDAEFCVKQFERNRQTILEGDSDAKKAHVEPLKWKVIDLGKE